MRPWLERNVSAEALDALVDTLPCMRRPTVSQLHADGGFAIKVAVPRKGLPELIPRIKATGGTDVVVYELSQIVP